MNTAALYVICYVGLVALGIVILRDIVLKDYQKRGKLSTWVTVAQALLFFLYGGFPTIYLQMDWPAVHVPKLLYAIGLIILLGGIMGLFYGMFRIGVTQSMGQGNQQLQRSGIYAWSRNPQAIFCGLYVIGFTILWPSWYAVGWALMYGILIHMMVLAEEEHLRKLHGQAYEEYCQAVPRYIKLIEMSKDEGA
jgi:protein-S-isoprenylcysteine O-methyltransferase Ste14